MIIKKVLKAWNNYKYRLVPWLSLHIQDKKSDSVQSESSPQRPTICVHHLTKKEDSLITSSELGFFLKNLFQEFDYVDIQSNEEDRRAVHVKNADTMYKMMGFVIGKQKSTVCSDAGTGVFVQRGTAKAGSIVALYAGTIYFPSEPLFLASIFNPFIFRTKDSLLIDGNDKRISKSVYKGCAYRDQFNWDVPCCDLSWLTIYPLNPLNIGQYVNNESHQSSHNVVYQECELSDTMIPYHLWRFLPNVWYNPVHNKGGLKLIPLVAVRDIMEGEELLSSYFTILHD